MQFQDASILAIVVPAILLRAAPAQHTALLAAIATAVATAWVFAPPIAGALSDRARRRGGDRRVETAIALGIDVVALLAMAASHAAGAIAVEVVCAAIAIATASSIYQALLPEVVPREAWGASAGARGAMTLVGTVAGLAAASLLPPQGALLAMAAAIAIVLPTLAAIPREHPAAPRTRRAVVRDRHDLNVTVVARGWIVLGMTLLNTYVLYFFNDVLRVRDASLGTGMVAGAALLGAILSSVLAGVLSDKLDRRIVVALSGVPMVAAALGFAIAPDRTLIFAYAALFGLGYGGVFSVGWALALDAVPELGDVARDLGVWGTISNLPGVAAPALGAWIIAHGATPRDGYRALFAVAAFAFAAGSLTVLRVGRRPVSSAWSVLFLVVVTAIRQPWLATKFRVRQWGRLPFRRGPTLLIANHQHEDESEIVAERSFAQGAWHSTTLTASSRRMWEPGFFAARLPLLAPLTRDVNAGPFFEALGMYPLENELSVRPLHSIAYVLERIAPGAAAADAFRGDALAALPPGVTRVADLLAPRYALDAERRVKIAHLADPYRRLFLDAMRAEIDADIARIVDLVRRGATFYVTPEGFYSTDGRMRPLKGIVDHLVPVADVRLAAIAFDPFRGRRLSMLYQVCRPADPADLATSLAAARPVTVSALLATWMLAVALPFTAAEAEAGVARARAALPAGAFVDPEVARDAPACVREALATLRMHRTLAFDGGRYALADARGDARFPLGDDVVAYQAAFLEETIAALRRLA